MMEWSDCTGNCELCLKEKTVLQVHARQGVYWGKWEYFPVCLLACKECCVEEWGRESIYQAHDEYWKAKHESQ